MMEPPWLQDPALEMVAMLLDSYKAAYGAPLMGGLGQGDNRRLRAQELFTTDQAVLAHDGGEDPRLIYANGTALRLWNRSWPEMIGMPSRLTAEPQERGERARALMQAQNKGALRGYGGIRVDSNGRRFRIEGAKVWTLRDGGGGLHGQAACFANWWWLP